MNYKEVNMITTTEFRMDVLRAAINFIGNELKVHIFEESSFDKKEPLKFGVNWSACGTCSYKEAYEYAANLEKAAEVAEMITDLQLNRRTSDMEQPEIWEQYDLKDYETLFTAEVSKIKMYILDGKDVDLREYMEDGI